MSTIASGVPAIRRREGQYAYSLCVAQNTAADIPLARLCRWTQGGFDMESLFPVVVCLAKDEGLSLWKKGRTDIGEQLAASHHVKDLISFRAFVSPKDS